MSSDALILIGFVLLLLLVLVAAARLVKLKGGRPREAPVYIVNDAVDLAVSSLDSVVLERIGRTGVRRIIEWSTHYLQGLAVPARQRKGLQVVAGGQGAAIEYIRGELARRGHDYSLSDIAEVLAAEAAYLAGIGALGERVKEQELL